MNRVKQWLFKLFDITTGDDCVESIVLDLEPRVWESSGSRLRNMSLAECRGYLRARYSVVIRAALAQRFNQEYSHKLDPYLDLVVSRLHSRLAVALTESRPMSRRAA